MTPSGKRAGKKSRAARVVPDRKTAGHAAGFAGGVSRDGRITRWQERRRTGMLWTIFVILVVLWLLGMVSSYTLGGYIHLLLLLAIAVVLIRVIQGRRPV